MGGAILHLIRNHDLRLTDNPALHHAHSQATREHVPLYLLYCHDDHVAQDSAAALWQRHNLGALAQHINQCGGQLGSSTHADLPALIDSQRIHSVHWNRRYDPTGMACDRKLKSDLRQAGIQVRSHPGNLLFEPFDPRTLNQQGQPYKVYTPFANNLLTHLEQISAPLPAPLHLEVAAQRIADTVATPQADHAWQRNILQHWESGEAHAVARCQQWLAQHSGAYQVQRDYPGADAATSRLSPYLACGAISVRQILHAVRSAHSLDDPNLHTFVKELLWREFAQHILYHYPDTLTRPFQSKFNRFPWRRGAAYPHWLAQWQRGQSGIPLVDAGMRELWATGWMHNRVRMVVASWLTKNLGLHWQHGAEWFMHTLIDADIASNTMGWQWVAGCGVDAAPYFRIFNPLTQAQKFDPEARYVQRWLPELDGLSAKQCHAPWSHCPYPEPVVDPKQSRKAALAQYKAL